MNKAATFKRAGIAIPIILAVLYQTPGAAALPAAQTTDGFAGVRALIQEEIKKPGVPSISVGVAKDGRIIWEESFGYANLEKKIPATPRTMYSLASISKPFTSTAVMLLAERGLVDLDKPVNSYLGAAKLKAFVGKASGVKVRQVLDHTAGLATHWNFFYANEPFRRPDPEESIRRYGILVTPPGQTFNYSNFGYGILEYIIERVSGRSYPEFMKKEIFEPLGLTHTAVLTEPPQEGDAAARYAGRGSLLPFYDFDHRGASAVYSSAHDLVRFGLFHLKNRDAGMKPILRDKSLEKMRAKSKSASYALGWGVGDRFGYKIFGHSGGMPGVATDLTLLPDEKIAVAVLINGQETAPGRLVNEILAALLPPFAEKWNREKAKPAEPRRTEPPIPGDLPGEWEGRLETYEGPHPVRLILDAEGRVQYMFLDGRPEATPEKPSSGKLRFIDGLLTGNIGAKIPTADAQRAPHFTWVSLRLRDGRLSGAASARPISERYCLPSFLELKKKGS